MGHSFRKSFKIGKNSRINISRAGGVGFSTGGKGFRVSTNAKGTRVTGSIPGTGVRYQKSVVKGSGCLSTIVLVVLLLAVTLVVF